MTTYTSADPLTLSPGEIKAVRFACDDGTERIFIVKASDDIGVSAISVITDDGVVSAPVEDMS